MWRHVGSARTFQSVGGPVRRHSFTFLPGLEDPAGVTCLALMEQGGFRLVRVLAEFWQPCLWAGGLLTFLLLYPLESCHGDWHEDGSQPGREGEFQVERNRQAHTHSCSQNTTLCVHNDLKKKKHVVSSLVWVDGLTIVSFLTCPKKQHQLRPVN